MKADAERLYVLLARTREVTEHFARDRTTVTPTTVVQVFRLKDGELLQEVALPKPLHTADFKLVSDQPNRVPLTATKDGLVIGDEKTPHARFRFTAKRALELEPAADKK